jgi:RecB family exonuclease
VGLTLITGRANAGKTGIIYGALRAAAAQAGTRSLLLPTHPDVVRARAEFSRTDPVGLHVGQLDAWAAEAWAVHGDGRLPVTPAQRAVLLCGVLESARPGAVGRSIGTPGFVRLMTYVVRRAAEESPLDSWPAPSPGVDSELVDLLRTYEDGLAATGLIEPGRAVRLLARETPPPEGPIFIHRFSDLTPSQESLVVSLASTREVWITLPWEEGFPATEALDPLVSRLEDAADRHEHVATDHHAATELDRFEAGIFRAPKPGVSTGSVRFCTAAGAEAEAALIAEQALEAVRRFGAGRVAIVFRDAQRSADRLRVALAGAGVPADTDILLPVSRTAFGAALSRLLRAVSADRTPAGLAAFLRSPFARLPADDADRLDARWRGEPAMSAAKACGEAARCGVGLGRAIKLARRVTSAPLSGEALADWKELADALLSAAHDMRGLQDDADATLDAAAHRALLDAVSSLTEIGDGRLRHTDVLAALQDAHASPAAATHPGHVLVTEAHRLRSRRYDAVIVGGLTAGDFSTEGRSSASAEIADRLFGTERASDQAYERLLFYSVCTRARELLVLTRQTADSEGNAVRPSVFWEEALDLYRPPSADAALQEEDAVVHEAVRLSDLHRTAPALTPGRSHLRREAAGAAAGSDDGVSNARLRAASRRGRIDDTSLLEKLAGTDEFSVTELELYARCPYRWFYERVVRPDSPDVAFDARSRGDLAHRTLAAFYRELPSRLGSARVTPEVLGAALELADEAFERALADDRTPARVTLAEEDHVIHTRESVKALITRDQEFLPGFAPAAAELRFGTAPSGIGSPEGSGPVDLGGLRLRGSIDRVDVGDGGLVVIDYKSGTAPKRADLVDDRALQIPLYAAVASRLLGQPPVAGLYRSLKSGESRGFFVKGLVDPGGLTATDGLEDQEAADELIATVVGIAREAADGIQAGAIPVSPVSAKACEYCAAAPVCGRGA